MLFATLTGVNISVLVGDDDSSAIKRLRDTCGVDIEKSSDLNHMKKNLGNALYKLKGEGHKELSDKVIKYIQKCFSYAITQNARKPDSLKLALAACVPHMYGEHATCGAWCEYSKDPENYRHSSLPYGKDLSNTSTKAALTKLFNGYVNNADKLCHYGSSQANESLNNTIASKQPKSRHYGSSASFSYRVSAAVCQKNLGYTYVDGVCSEIGLSPSKHARTLGEREDISRKRKALRHSTR